MNDKNHGVRVNALRRRGPAAAGALSVLVAGGLAMVASPASAEADGDGIQLRADFNGDGVQDLAIGVPGEDQFGTDDGVVNVIYGRVNGLNAVGNQVWSQNSPGIGGVAESGDQFGHSIAAADFDGDGFTDLAIGVPGENQFAVDDGVVNVIYGSAAGLAPPGNQVWSQNSPGIAGVAESGDRFGTSLAAGNFGRGSRADLAIGVPLEDQAAVDDGAVNVLYGAAAGLTSAGNQVWSQNTAGIAGVSEAGDRFGSSLAAGNLGRSSFADLAIGVPLEDQAGVNDGAVNVIYGTSNGLSSAGNQVWSQNTAGVGGVAEAGDQFGFSLAIGNFGRTSHGDLAIGVPLEDQAGVNDGAVNVLYGTAGSGLNAAGNQVWSQNTAGVGGVSEAGDQFGFSLAAGDFGRGTRADLAIGVPLEDQAGVNDGAVNVLYGAAAGLSAAGNQVWSQNTAGVAGVSEAGDQFGYSLTAGNFGRGSRADLAVGVPLEDQAGTNDGAVNVIYSTANGLTSAGNQVWSQNSPGIGGVAETGDFFGRSLATRTS